MLVDLGGNEFKEAPGATDQFVFLFLLVSVLRTP